MQMFGVGVMELMVILLLAVLVVGPDRMPALAADLARWIRQGRAYARHIIGDFSQVVGELEKEAGASREDWQEIANVVTRNTGDIGKELEKVTKEAKESGDLEFAKDKEPDEPAKSNGAAAKVSATAETESGEAAEADAETAEEKPWYVPEKATRASRRRSSK